MLHVIYIGLKQNVYSISSVPTALLRYAAASHHDGEREELPDIRLSRSGDELLSLWWCLDDYNLGKAMCGEAVLASPSLVTCTEADRDLLSLNTKLRISQLRSQHTLHNFINI